MVQIPSLDILCGFVCLCVVSCTSGNGEKSHEKDTAKTPPLEPVVWQLDNLETIGGHPVTVIGSPDIIETPEGKALAFDGYADGIEIGVHPLEGAEAFTLEVVFRPDGDGPQAQRFFHLQEDGVDNRILVETRMTDDGRWYLDTYIRSGLTDQTLADSTMTHLADQWHSAALIFDGREMRHYVDGEKELAAVLPSFTPPKAGKTALGVRMNRVYWFKGAIRMTRFTRRALPPEELLKP